MRHLWSLLLVSTLVGCGEAVTGPENVAQGDDQGAGQCGAPSPPAVDPSRAAQCGGEAAAEQNGVPGACCGARMCRGLRGGCGCAGNRKQCGD